MRGIIVIDEAGITRASVGFEEIAGNTDLFGTVLSALQTFALSFSGGEMKEIEFGTLRLLITPAGDGYAMTLHSVDDADAHWKNSVVVELIEERGGNLNDGFLFLISELLTDEEITTEEAEMGIQSLAEKEPTW
ncbi:MAG: hypothetical protein ACW97A_11325 [Candidatus Thorarchaeota archaeon]|jgi:hypothetical protein